MKVLFLHPNFPGQFIRPILLALQKGYEVTFLCQTHHNRIIKGVKRITLKEELSHDELEKLNLRGLKKTLKLADQYLEAMKSIKKSNWNPDIIISHSGFGCGLHVSQVWPNAHSIAYIEWWFRNNSPLNRYDQNSKWWSGPSENPKNRERNLSLGLELIEANILISPTQWQRSQLPLSLKKRCMILPDGIDRNRFKPNIEPKKIENLITYGTRGMEPMRGFPEFIESIPKILEREESINIEIAGEDRICYGGKKPTEGSYGNWAKEYLAEWIEREQVKFIGTLTPSDYQKWLARSTIHVYLTRPFVASWSLLEAMASGCCIVASDTEPVKEFLDETSGVLINHKDPENISEAILKLMKSPNKRKTYGQMARRQSEKWSEERSFKAWSELMDSLLGNAD